MTNNIIKCDSTKHPIQKNGVSVPPRPSESNNNPSKKGSNPKKGK